ncbi:MAG: GTP-binding protein [Erysipelotrichaceae bacterium]|nr:GTP-binding protein [Erysipelotrichaceae bacterium]MDY5252071.1 GTP-binding protein [Erysipelotrichaceae bacterium]
MTKIDIISGFLGSGKTTLIKKLLNESLQNEKLVLIENEFGQIGIDGDFLKDTAVEIKEINAGCICCSLQGDFEEALQQVITTYAPDRIVIEPSGVGKLSDVIKAVQTVNDTKINALCTIVDAKKCKIYARNFQEFFNDQIASAQCIIMSKTQNLSQEKLQEAYDIIKNINPNARIVTTSWDNLTGNTIMTVMEHNVDLFNDDACQCGCHDHEHNCGCHEHEHDHDHDCCCHEDKHDHDHDCCCHEHDHHHECGCHEHDHAHHHHHADEVFTSIGLETINKYTKEELYDILSQLDDNILRAKGVVNSDEGWLFFDYVSSDIDIRKGNPNYTGLISVIGSNIDEAKIKELFKVC